MTRPTFPLAAIVALNLAGCYARPFDPLTDAAFAPEAIRFIEEVGMQQELWYSDLLIETQATAARDSSDPALVTRIRYHIFPNHHFLTRLSLGLIPGEHFAPWEVEVVYTSTTGSERYETAGIDDGLVWLGAPLVALLPSWKLSFTDGGADPAEREVYTELNRLAREDRQARE